MFLFHTVKIKWNLLLTFEPFTDMCFILLCCLLFYDDFCVCFLCFRAESLPQELSAAAQVELCDFCLTTQQLLPSFLVFGSFIPKLFFFSFERFYLDLTCSGVFFRLHRSVTWLWYVTKRVLSADDSSWFSWSSPSIGVCFLRCGSAPSDHVALMRSATWGSILERANGQQRAWPTCQNRQAGHAFGKHRLLKWVTYQHHLTLW